MKTISYWLLVAVTLLSCGVLRADPTSQGHSLWDHKELFTPAFCVASYAIVLEQVPPRTPRIVVEDLARRGAGLYVVVEDSIESIGHTTDEWEAQMTRITYDIEHNWTPRAWRAGVVLNDCKGLTETWAVWHPPDSLEDYL
jgi:hypothetical protein